MKFLFFAILIIQIFPGNLIAQLLPDTLMYDFNPGLPNAQWEFSFVQITDIHIGDDETDDDYGTPGWNDELTGSENETPVQNLRNIVNWINQNKSEYKINFVIITGDITESGEKSEFLLAKQILDSLSTPYILLPGNHDLWPHCDTDEASYPNGDSLFHSIYSAHLDSMKPYFTNWNDGTRMTKTWNPINNCWSRLYNFSFQKGSYKFICNDFGSRTKYPYGISGTMPSADLLNFTGGTWNWFTQSVASNASQDETIIFFQHFPMDYIPYTTLVSFSSAEYDSLMNFLEPYSSSVGLCVAGHMHRDKVYSIKKSTFSSTIATGVETDANKDFTNGKIRIFRMWDTPASADNIDSKSQFVIYPNPAHAQLKIIATVPDYLVEITDLSGKILYQKKFNEKENYIELQFLTTGMYFLKATGNNFSILQKLLIE